MKAAPTLEGGLRIDAEDEQDWEVLQAITHDARSSNSDLAAELGAAIDGEDWKEYVVPDLRSEFEQQLDRVSMAIQSAMKSANGGAGPIWITRGDGFLWYGALNQARLAIEELHQFGPKEMVSIGELNPVSRSAFLRSYFYLELQSFLLDHVMR